MTGNDFDIRRELRNDLCHAVNHAVDAAAAFDIDEGKAVSDEVVAHVNDIRVREENDRVAVSMSSGEIEGANVFAVQVHRNVVIKGDDGEGLVRRGRVLPM